MPLPRYLRRAVREEEEIKDDGKIAYFMGKESRCHDQSSVYLQYNEEETADLSTCIHES